MQIDREALIQKLRDLFYSYQDSSDGDALEEAIEILSAPALASQEGAQAGEVVKPVSDAIDAYYCAAEESVAIGMSSDASREVFLAACDRLRSARSDLEAAIAATTPPAPDDAVRAVEAEREACAKAVEDYGWLGPSERDTLMAVAHIIRARKGGAA